MKRFKHILFVADQAGVENPAFARALELAHANQARLTVMDVVEPMIWSADNQARFGTDLTHILRDRRLDELAALTGPHTRADFPLATRVAIGTPFLEVIRAVIADRHDLVIKSAESPGGMRQRILGPNDQHLIRKCPCPVWIDREERPRPYRKILAAVDPVGDADLQLDRTIVDLATSFVPWEGSEVHVAHAWHLSGESALRDGRVGISELRLQELLAEKQASHRKAMETLLADYDLSMTSPNVHFEKGAPAPIIATLARRLPADLIVIGTVGRTGIPGFFIGNTAESVMQVSDLPVPTVKPSGFVSPITA